VRVFGAARPSADRRFCARPVSQSPLISTPGLKARILSANATRLFIQANRSDGCVGQLWAVTYVDVAFVTAPSPAGHVTNVVTNAVTNSLLRDQGSRRAVQAANVSLDRRAGGRTSLTGASICLGRWERVRPSKRRPLVVGRSRGDAGTGRWSSRRRSARSDRGVVAWRRGCGRGASTGGRRSVGSRTQRRCGGP
jgi:hypothetical protein